MLPICIGVAAFGLLLATLLFVATKLQWPIAATLHRWAPWMTTLAGATLLGMFVLNSVSDTTAVTEALAKGLKDAEHSLRNWFASLAPR